MFPDLPSLRFRPKQYRVGSIGNWSGLLPVAADLIAATRPSVLVELGTHYGESYFGFCQAIEELGITGSAYAVDTWAGDLHAGVYGPAVYDYVSGYNAEHYGRFSSLLRMTFDQAVDEFGDGTIDLLHLDGYHTYSAVKHDFETWLPKVSINGIILIHDVGVRYHDFGAWKLWEEVSARFPSFTFHHSCGLGVMMNSQAQHFSNRYFAALFGGAADPQNIRDYYVLCAERLEFEHRARSARFTTCQVYFPCEANYSESRSISLEVPFGVWTDIDFDVPVAGGVLRLDPSRCRALIEISEMKVIACSSGKVVWQSTNSLDQVSFGGSAAGFKGPDRLIVLSDGDDPQVFLPCIEDSEPTDFLRLRLRIRIQEKTEVVAGLLRTGLAPVAGPLMEHDSAR